METRDAIAVEQAQTIHRNTATAVVGGFFVACVAASAFWGVVEQAYLVAWLAANFLLALCRFVVWRAFRNRAFSPALAQRWLRHAMAGAGLSGAVWGAGALFMFPPGEIGFHLIYVFAVMMMGVAAMFSFGLHQPTFLSFFLLSAVPAMLGLVAQGTLLHWEIALAIAIFIAVALRFGREFNRVFLKAQQLRFENVDLVGQLTGQMEAAKSANLAKSRFLAAASHDLRQPMHALNLYLGTLAGLELSAPAKATLGNVSQCAQTMDEMFHALLDISRLDAGAVQPELRELAIAPLLERIRLEFEPQVRAKGLELRVAPCSASIRADPAFVERILRNLVSNAVRYTRRGRILVGCRRKHGALQIAVHDTGPGIAPEEQRLVFEEFYQSANPERHRSKGMGLGLAIVERLAKLMQASVRLVSRPGDGSMFALELPLAACAAAGAQAARPVGAGGSFAGSLVIVIDDEEMILSATRSLLEQWQCTVVTAISGSNAVEKLSTSPRAPDAIVCDYRLRGGENGLHAIDQLRAEFNEDIPAVLVTGDTGPDRLREIAASGTSVLHKPVQEKTLRDALAQLLGVGPA
jgi:signal transduction histidine kinase/CheY-like chemotaxis protein